MFFREKKLQLKKTKMGENCIRNSPRCLISIRNIKLNAKKVLNNGIFLKIPFFSIKGIFLRKTIFGGFSLDFDSYQTK